MTRRSNPLRRLTTWMGGIERVGGGGLPVEEFVHPWPLLAMAMLGVNDHLLKGSGWLPGWVTGKLSDFSGLFWFPLFLTALLDTLLYVAFRLTRGRTPDPSLSMAKLYGAVLFTAILFVPLKLSDTWGTLYIEAMQALDVFELFGNFQVTRDPTDLSAVAMFPLVILFGRGFVRRIPLGRLRALERSVRDLPAEERRARLTARTRDIRRLLRKAPHREQALDRFLDGFDAALRPRSPEREQARAQELLDRYRDTLERGP
ncbi:MAG: hypothetical protein ABI333_06135 [bacterium]